MRILIQVTSSSDVSVNNNTISNINNGYCIFVGFTHDDNEKIVKKMCKKISNLRIFKDENGKTNLSILDVKGSILLISQFTLYANCSHGNRPSFIEAMEPNKANDLYELMLNELQDIYNITTYRGAFGEHMVVNIVNEGPFTVYLDSDIIFKNK